MVISLRIIAALFRFGFCVTTQTTEYTPAQIYGRLLRYAIPHWKVGVLSIICMALFAATDAAVAWMMRPLIDGGFVDRDPLIIKIIGPALILLFLIRGIGTFGSSLGMSYIGRHIVAQLRQRVFAHLVHQPVSFLDNTPRGDAIAMATYHVEQLAAASTNAFKTVIKDGLTIVFLLIFLIYTSWKLSLFILVVAPVIGLAIVWVNTRFRKISNRIQSSIGDVAQGVYTAVDGQRVIKTFGGEQYETERFAVTNEANRRLSMKMAITESASTPVVQFIASFALAAVVFFAINAEPPMKPGEFAAFLAAMIGLLRPLKAITQVSAVLQRGIAAGGEIFAFIDSDVEKNTGTHTVTRVAGKMQFRQLAFGYDEAAAPVLHDIDLQVEAGETVALVGHSGSGKSTLVSLLPRFYEPSSGEITLDDVSLNDYDLVNLRSQIALVSQQIVLFSGTVRSNIAYGQDIVDEERLKAACISAHAWEFIEKLPEQLDSAVGENGVKFSGGQRQRLAIARAIYKDAPLLILDEATAALDTESERKIQAALEELMTNRTTLVIAHRLSTIENADRIVVMESGRIVEIGKHQELLDLNGHYARLCQMQFGNEQTEGG